jgi:hypothetical protein
MKEHNFYEARVSWLQGTSTYLLEAVHSVHNCPDIKRNDLSFISTKWPVIGFSAYSASHQALCQMLGLLFDLNGW